MPKRGFSLMELILVIAIMAILTAAMVPMFKVNRLQAQTSKANADLDAIKSAAMLYQSDTGAWPAARSDGIGLVTNDNVANWNGPYLDAWRNDPWSHSYYLANAASGGFTGLSAGSSGPDGRQGSADDITLLITPKI